MTEIILHQYAASPFSHKVIKILAHKGLPWHAVEQPVVAPKPDLTPLTGGYRKIPVLQIGAHIYCDTLLIIRELEKRFPETPLTPPHLAHAAEMIADWTDHRVFTNAAMPTVFEMAEFLPPEFLQDRAAMQNPATLGAAPSPEHARAQFVQDCLMMERQLAETPFLLGDSFTLADAAAYHIVNFAANGPTLAAEIAKLPKLSAWRQRIVDMGEGARSEMEPQTALDIARSAEPDMTPPANAITFPDLPVGASISIKPDDYGQEVSGGTLVWATDDEIAIKREDADVGSVMVHYPRLGYVITQEG